MFHCEALSMYPVFDPHPPPVTHCVLERDEKKKCTRRLDVIYIFLCITSRPQKLSPKVNFIRVTLNSSENI